MQLDFRASKHRRWSLVTNEAGHVHACGWCEIDGRIVSGEALARAVAALRQDNLTAFSYPGEYAVAVQCNGPVVLLADGIRSIPLLYSIEGERVVVSDEAALLSPQVRQLDAECADEFLAAGFVTGPRSMYADIRALQAGEVVSIESGAVTRSDSFLYHCRYDASDDEQSLIAAHDEAVLAAFERMLASIGDRQLVLPLSGGLDSRLVASTLKRLGRENVLCFTYGMAGGAEDGPSRVVADVLGYERVLVPYDQQQLRAGLGSDEAMRFRDYCAGAVSSPHLDDWLAVKQLKESGRIDPDAVFVPGHTGDFICGGHLKHLFDPAHTVDPYGFDEAMLTKHFSLWRGHVARPEVRNLLKARLAESLAGLARDSFEELAAAYELWEWRERQAKFIINSVRSYEWHGFEWRVPLWDRALMEFWMRVPLALKHEKYLYRAALQAADETGVFQGVAPSAPWDRDAAVAKVAGKVARPRQKLKRWLRNLPFVSDVCQRQLDRRRLIRDYDEHPVGLAQLWDRDAYVGSELDKRHSQSLLTREFLCQINLL